MLVVIDELVVALLLIVDATIIVESNELFDVLLLEVLVVNSIAVVISPLETTVSLLEPRRTIPVFRLAEIGRAHV